VSSWWRGGERSRRDAQEEIDFYLEMRAAELRRQGMSEDEARRAAREAFGDRDRIEWEVVRMDERMRRRRSVRETLASLLHDVRYAGRFLAGNPGFTLVAVATLALGIGATTAMFSLLDEVLLRRPAVESPESLVAVYTTCRLGAPRCSSSWPDYVDYRDRTDALADLAVQSATTASLGEPGAGLQVVRLEGVTGNFFQVLGVTPEHGRLIQPADDLLGAGEPVVVLSHRLWRDRFAAAPDVVGRSVRLNDQPFEVVGVVDREYEGVALDADTEMWIPLQRITGVVPGMPAGMDVWQQRDSRWMGRLVGRLAPGAAVEQARTELLALSERMREESPAARGPRSITVDPIGRYLAPNGAETDLPRFVWLLLGVVGATLLLACANLANLQLARGSSRGAEIGVRIAIGAGRGRLVRQLLVESLVLAALGGAVGLVLALAILALLGPFELPGGLPITSLDAGLDMRALAVSGGLVVVSAVLCGLVPALQATGSGVAEALKAGRSPEGRRGGGRLRGSLVAAQVALCVVLLVGSGLFVRTLRSALSSDLGFEAREVALTTFNLSLLGYEPPEAFAFVEALTERARARPEVRSVAVGSVIPILGGARRGTFATVEGYEPAPDEEMRVDRVLVTPGYFETLGIPLLAGRDLEPADATGGEQVALVSREMAERYWPGGEAVGGSFSLFGSGAWRVIGVVEDVRWRELSEETTNFAFFALTPSTSEAASILSLAVGTEGDAESLLPQLRTEARALEPDLTLAESTTMDGAIGDLLMPQRVGAAFLSGFAVLALLLAAVGIAGVVSYTVGEQRRSIGVRMALGAGRGEVLRLVLWSMTVPVGVGLVAGIGAAVALDGAVERFLYGVAPGDPLTYGTIAVMLAAIAFVATLLPARAATRVDPLEVLRAE